MLPITGGLCFVCGERLGSPFAAAGERCGLCRRAEPPFAKAVAYGSYDGRLRELIHLLKYDQVRTCAGVLGRMLRILERHRETQSQIGLTRHQRRENMRGAFAVGNPDAVKCQEILIVDDVFTTGTTVSECARVLRRAGASKVYVATVARTLKAGSAVNGMAARRRTSGDGGRGLTKV
jgi:predicted amidophosphoribosyltransferase